jgi:hypothetical protein
MTPHPAPEELRLACPSDHKSDGLRTGWEIHS